MEQKKCYNCEHVCLLSALHKYIPLALYLSIQNFNDDHNEGCEIIEFIYVNIDIAHTTCNTTVC